MDDGQLALAVSRTRQQFPLSAPPDVIRITQEGDLEGFCVAADYVDGHVIQAGKLDQVAALLVAWCEANRPAKDAASRVGLGVEIGTSVAKLFGRIWVKSASGWAAPGAVVDLKFALPSAMTADRAVGFYTDWLTLLQRALVRHRTRATDLTSFIAAARFDVANPQRLFEDTRGGDFVYCYGTQGARASFRRSHQPAPPELKILSGDDEGRLLFAVAVPDAFQKRPGTVMMEVGSGSTELVLAGVDGIVVTLSLALGAKASGALSALVASLRETRLTDELVPILESERPVAERFLLELDTLKHVGVAFRLFINPNRDSRRFREALRASDPASGNGHTLDLERLAVYAARHKADPFADKAEILAAIAGALGAREIAEGRRGGLKAGAASFVQAALQSTA